MQTTLQTSEMKRVMRKSAKVMGIPPNFGEPVEIAANGGEFTFDAHYVQDRERAKLIAKNYPKEAAYVEATITRFQTAGYSRDRFLTDLKKASRPLSDEEDAVWVKRAQEGLDSGMLDGDQTAERAKKRRRADA